MGDTFAVRASGFYRSDGGYIDSIGNNPIPALQDPSVNIVDGTLVEGDINDIEVVGGRVSALFTPSETFSLDLTVHYQDINSDNQGTFRGRPDDAAAAVRPARRLALPQRADRHRVPALQRDARLGLRRRLAAVRDELQRVPRKTSSATSPRST